MPSDAMTDAVPRGYSVYQLTDSYLGTGWFYDSPGQAEWEHPMGPFGTREECIAELISWEGLSEDYTP